MKRIILGILLVMAGVLAWLGLTSHLRTAWSMSEFAKITTDIPHLPFERLDCPPALLLPGQTVPLRVWVHNPEEQAQEYILGLDSNRLTANSSPGERIILQPGQTASFTWQLKASRVGATTITVFAVSSLDGTDLTAYHPWDHSFRQVCPNLVITWTHTAIFLAGLGQVTAGISMIMRPHSSRRGL